MKRIGLLLMVASVIAALISTLGQIESLSDNNRLQFLWWLLMPTYFIILLIWVLLRPNSAFSRIHIIASLLAIIAIGGSLIAIANGTLQAVSTWLNIIALYNIPFFFGFSYYLAKYQEKK